MSSPHWPLGRGDHAQARGLTFLAATLGMASLAVSALACVDGTDYFEVAAAARFWGAVLFVALVVQHSVQLLYSPAVLATVLGTPADGPRLYPLMDPTRRWSVRGLPYVCGACAMFPLVATLSVLHTLIGIIFACSLFRLLSPVLVWGAVRWRKGVVPYGHYAACTACVLAYAGLFASFPAPTARGGRPPFILDPMPWWVWLVSALIFIAIEPVVRRWCRTRTIRLYRRDELVDYAFPAEGERGRDPGRLVVEAVGGGHRRRRFVFLVQEATGLHRVADWVKASVLGAGVLALWFALAWVFGWRAGSTLHLLATVVPLAAVGVWGAARPLVVSGGDIRKPLGAYALPVSHLEMFGVRVVALSAMYFGLGIVLALALAPVEASGQPVLERLTAAVVNLVHLWLLLVGGGAYVSLMCSRGKGVLPRVPDFFVFMLLQTSIMAVLMAPDTSLGSETVFWRQHLPSAGKMVVFAFALLRDVSGGWAVFLATETWRKAIPSWGYGLWAWTQAVGLCLICVHLFITKVRGRGHPAYGRCPLASKSGSGLHTILEIP
jgi:hypothetical protein